MNNREISRIINSKPHLKEIFVGVYPADGLPKKPRNQKPSAYIANTHKAYQPGEHWITFYCPADGPMEYFDSYGLDPKEDYNTFLGDRYLRSIKFIQNPLSVMCGQYCIYYIVMRTKGYNMHDIISCFTNCTTENDLMVNTFIESYFDVDLDIYDFDYIGKQIAQSFETKT